MMAESPMKTSYEANKATLAGKIERFELAIRGSSETTYSGGDGYNPMMDNYRDFASWDKAVKSSIQFMNDSKAKYLLLLKECAQKTGETYVSKIGKTLPKCSGLGGDAKVIFSLNLPANPDDAADALYQFILEYSPTP